MPDWIGSSLPASSIRLDEDFPDDTLGLPADTTPRVDIEARRQALETEGFPARDDIFRQLKDLPGFMVFEYRGEQVRLEVAEQRIGLLGDAQVNRGRRRPDRGHDPVSRQREIHVRPGEHPAGR